MPEYSLLSPLFHIKVLEQYEKRLLKHDSFESAADKEFWNKITAFVFARIDFKTTPKPVYQRYLKARRLLGQYIINLIEQDNLQELQNLQENGFRIDFNFNDKKTLMHLIAKNSSSKSLNWVIQEHQKNDIPIKVLDILYFVMAKDIETLDKIRQHGLRVSIDDQGETPACLDYHIARAAIDYSYHLGLEKNAPIVAIFKHILKTTNSIQGEYERDIHTSLFSKRLLFLSYRRNEIATFKAYVEHSDLETLQLISQFFEQQKQKGVYAYTHMTPEKKEMLDDLKQHTQTLIDKEQLEDKLPASNSVLKNKPNKI